MGVVVYTQGPAWPLVKTQQYFDVNRPPLSVGGRSAGGWCDVGPLDGMRGWGLAHM